jgi:hypothetical protein
MLEISVVQLRKFILDAMAVKLKCTMAVSIYPKANPLWGETSTITVAHTLRSYSSTFDYPYPKAVSVSAEDQEWNIL